ncbi:hypothetical protein HN51_043931 [Arachis hypogaea]
MSELGGSNCFPCLLLGVNVSLALVEGIVAFFALFQVLEYLAVGKILTFEHINGGLPCHGMERWNKKPEKPADTSQFRSQLDALGLRIVDITAHGYQFRPIHGVICVH